MKQRRVAITGIGMVTPCGYGWRPYWAAVVGGEPHLRHISHLALDDFPAKVAGEIVDFDPAAFVKSRKSLKLMSREIQLAVAASQLAVEDSAVQLEERDRARFGISLGTGIINTELDELGAGIRASLDERGQFQMRKFGQEGLRALYPLWFLKYLPNMPACHISIAHGLRGPSNTITTSAAAAAQAIGEAYRIIERGDADMMLAGGTDSKINAIGMSRFHLLGLLSFRNHIPEKAYCPFDEQHDGVILGEGSGLLVLEEWGHAEKRGARIYGEILGYGSSSDFNYDPRSTEDFTGKRLAMVRALQDAETGPQEIPLLIANGSGIPQDDIQESHAVESVFKNAVSHLRVTSVKAITGHLVYGSGGVEIAAGLLSLHEGLIPPVANLESPDPACDLPFVKTRAEVYEFNQFLFNSFGFGGQNASLIVRKA